MYSENIILNGPNENKNGNDEISKLTYLKVKKNGQHIPKKKLQMSGVHKYNIRRPKL